MIGKRRAMASPPLTPRRRRLAAYCAALSVMLTLWLALNLRRAASRARSPKLHLTLPSRTSLQSIADDAATDHVLHPPSPPPSPHPLLAAAPPDLNLSDQELKDDVDQLIAHVDSQHDSPPLNASHPAANLSHPISLPHNHTLHSNQTLHNTTASIPDHTDHQTDQQPQQQQQPVPVNATEIDLRLNSQQYFDDAQSRLARMLADPHTKALIDENDLRTLHALQLQATRGDCEHASDSDVTLFKTDAEAASNLDIETSDPLWGAWCLFLGSYKTDAMRDFVTKQHVLEQRITALREQIPSLNQSHPQQPVPAPARLQPFDQNAASLGDVISPEEQSALRANTDRIMSHLRDVDVRYLAALSLQATFGDCAPYVREKGAENEEEQPPPELRVLKEPVLEQTAHRREGALWGAWCVLQGNNRTTAARQLVQRVDMLVDQLSKSQAQNAADDHPHGAGADTSSASTGGGDHSHLAVSRDADAVSDTSTAHASE